MLFVVNLAYADHITGGEMHYRYIGLQSGVPTYQVTLRLLMRCNSGRSFPDPIVISVFKNLDYARVQDITVLKADQTTIRLTNNNPCISNPPDVCYEVATYSFSVGLPSNAQGYTLAAQVNYRVNGLANAGGAGNIGATYTADIPGTGLIGNGFENNSAHFIGTDLVVVCANNRFTYSFNASDDDPTDSLRYSFCSAYQTGTSGGGGNTQPPIPPPYQLVPYTQGFSGDRPLGDAVKVDSKTGLVSGVAPGPGIYVVTVCVEEIRDGKVIAIQRKDIQLNITGCTVAEATLPDPYLLCKESNEITFSNQSTSPLIESYAWRLSNRQGAVITTSTQPQFTWQFTDTGTYHIRLNTNTGLTCPAADSADIFYYPGFKPDFTFKGLCFQTPTQFFDATTTRYGMVNKWSWDFGEPFNPSNFSNLQNDTIRYQDAGNKPASLIVSNINGCIDTISKTLLISTQPPLDFSFRDTLLCLPDTIRLFAEGEGSFSWANTGPPSILSGSNTPTPRVAPLQDTWYKVTQVLDNCTGRDSVHVRVVEVVSLTVMGDSSFCTGDSVILRTVSNANLYNWSPSLLVNDASLARPSASPQTLQTFKVEASISKCVKEATITLKPVNYPLANAGIDQQICFGATTQLLATHDGTRVIWSPASLLNNPNIGNPLASPKVTTDFILNVFDTKGCPKPGRDTMRVVVNPEVRISGVTDTSAVVNQPLQLDVVGAPNYHWIPSTYLSNVEIGNPVATFTQPYEFFQYQVIGSDDLGCSDSLLIRIRVFDKKAIYVPTAFTPNNDGLNETLKPTLAGMKSLTYFKVFNRFGEIVFSSTSPLQAWDGTFKGKKQATGNFIWMVQAVDYLGEVVQERGTTMLIR